MKQTKKTIVWLMAFLAVGSIQVFGQPFAEGPYLGQIPPGPIAQVFAPGLICHPGPHQWESHGHFSADGNTFCFSRRKYVYITENTDQGWTTPKRIEIIIENHWSAWSPCLSPDANSIFFTIAERHPRIKHYDLYRCNRTSHGWTKSQRLGPPLSSPSREITCSIAANNNIYIGSGRKGEIRCRIWVAPFVDNTWPRIIKLSLVGTHPGIAPDESFMVFTAIRPGGLGATDLYLTLRRPDGTWTEARNMGPRINSGYFEFGARISPDKKYMFFTRSNGWYENSYRDTSDIY